MSYLIALPNMNAMTVAAVLLRLCLPQGMPVILQSNNRKGFVAKIIGELMTLWPDCKIVNNSPRHPQSQGSVERANADVEKMLGKWMTDHKTKGWSVEIHFGTSEKK
jgi:hypothetical protein